jgi:ubiquitin-conjugating enzyme E2 variant
MKESASMLDSESLTREAPRGLRVVQAIGYVTYAIGMILLARNLWHTHEALGTGWLLVGAALAGYLLADLLSGVVHFLADNFGSPDTPLLGPGFVLPFRQHHVDPLGITRHGFFAANGNNALVCLPVLVPVVLALPVESRAGWAAGVGTFVLLFAVFLTNQTHKWAHMPAHEVPRVVRLLQRLHVILPQPHHDIHHTSPHDTHYCITVGLWNPLLERYRVFERLERFIRRWVPGTDPVMRVERERSLWERPMSRERAA